MVPADMRDAIEALHALVPSSRKPHIFGVSGNPPESRHSPPDEDATPTEVYLRTKDGEMHVLTGKQYEQYMAERNLGAGI